MCLPYIYFKSTTYILPICNFLQRIIYLTSNVLRKVENSSIFNILFQAVWGEMDSINFCRTRTRSHFWSPVNAMMKTYNYSFRPFVGIIAVSLFE